MYEKELQRIINASQNNALMIIAARMNTLAVLN